MLNRKMTREEGQAFKKRWQAINKMEIEELRNSSAETRLRQFFALQSWVGAFGWEAAMAEGVDEVRQRWVRLRRAAGV